MNLEITVHPGALTPEGLAVELSLRSKGRVAVDVLSVVGICEDGAELGPRILVPLPTKLVGERRLKIQLRIDEVVPAQVCCRAWLVGEKSPLEVRVPVEVGERYPGLSVAHVACLEEVSIEHDEDAFQVFVQDLFQGVDPAEMGLDEVEEALRDLMLDD